MPAEEPVELVLRAGDGVEVLKLAVEAAGGDGVGGPGVGRVGDGRAQSADTVMRPCRRYHDTAFVMSPSRRLRAHSRWALRDSNPRHLPCKRPSSGWADLH